ncbi:tetratricopeptide repeat protein [Polaribacter batillariae]|uniref:histidine kinase n=1 Tax=Polaribacter batillariae TaxID=2808900 RepID=A0ABX7SR32_9FLAO|nr:sensor histidine kinase [Polaribacter batillariae]QTD36699.1 tetratricopeptide repeat protein [Polaribacter batillariae]
MKLALFFLLIFLKTANYCYSQEVNKTIDSLKINLKKEKGKNKFYTYTNLSKEFVGINLDSAKKYANKAYNLSLELKSDSLKLQALKILGFRNFESGNYDIAIQKFDEALKTSINIKDSTSIADTYNGFAIIYSKKGDLKKSIEYNFKTLSIYEKINDSLGIGNTLMNIGWDYRKLKEFDKSLTYNLKSLKIYQNINNSLKVAMVNNNIAGTYNELSNYKKAIEYAKQSEEYFLKLNYKRFSAYPISVMAIAFDSLQQPKIAEKKYKEAITLHTKNREPFELAFLNYSLANLYYKQGSYSVAQQTAEKAFTFAKEVDSKEYIADISKLLSKIYDKLKKYNLSNTYLKLYVKYNDSIISSEKLKSIAEIETKYQTAKKEKEIAIQKEQLLEKELAIKNRNLYAILLGSALLILAIIFFAIYKRNQFKQKQLQKEIDLKDALATIKTQNKLQEQRLIISRDLHDNIGSQLTFIISSVDNLKFVTKDANTKLKDKLSGISTFTSETIHQLRDTIWAMNKSEITVEDLHTRILSFVEKAKNATENIDFIVNYNIDKNQAFSSLEGMNIFRVIQEAINNAIKYAKATKIEIKIDKKENQFVIKVVDNGIGFDINSVELGNGLSNMEKRMSEIGGRVKIISKVRIGTEIKIIV